MKFFRSLFHKSEPKPCGKEIKASETTRLSMEVKRRSKELNDATEKLTSTADELLKELLSAQLKHRDVDT